MGEPVRRGERLGRTIRGTKGHYLSTRGPKKAFFFGPRFMYVNREGTK